MNTACNGTESLRYTAGHLVKQKKSDNVSGNFSKLFVGVLKEDKAYV
jgi:hypothetical protein